jgi:uncharacterized membrane protein
MMGAMTPSRRSRSSPWLLAGLLVAAGTTHVVAPAPYVRIVPRALPAPEALVALSGVVELTCAVLVAVPRTRRIGAWATVVLFVAVFPANVQMAIDSGDGAGWYRAVAWARVPLQVPLVLWAVGVARRQRPDIAVPADPGPATRLPSDVDPPAGSGPREGRGGIRMRTRTAVLAWRSPREGRGGRQRRT